MKNEAAFDAAMDRCRQEHNGGESMTCDSENACSDRLTARDDMERAAVHDSFDDRHDTYREKRREGEGGWYARMLANMDEI